MTSHERPSWDFSRIPIHSQDRRGEATSWLSLPSLKIGAIGDPLEREADHIAEQVMRMPNPGFAVTLVPTRLNRKCAECEKEEEGARELRMKRDGASNVHASEAPPSVHDVLRSPGHPLEISARNFFDPRFGQDFSNVQVHSDERAARSAASIGAAAYASGSHVVFAKGRYDPSSAAGRHLIAHELAHVLQQAGTTARAVQRQPEANVGDAKKDAKLHRMARRPGEALTAWKTLKEADRNSILWIMADLYGANFESEFFKYANGEKTPNISATIANTSQFPPEKLTERGYRRADGGSPEIWVHPSGHEYQLIATSTAPDPPTEERCVEPCMNTTADEDDCQECCNKKIPERDDACRRMCHAACTTSKL